MDRRGFLSRVATGAGALALLPAARVFSVFKLTPAPADFSLLKRAIERAKPIRFRDQDQYVLLIHPSAAEHYGFHDGDLAGGFRICVAGVAA